MLRISSRSIPDSFCCRYYVLSSSCRFPPAVKRAAFLFRIFVREQQGEMQNRKSASSLDGTYRRSVFCHQRLNLARKS